jgi:hypothetical protein
MPQKLPNDNVQHTLVEGRDFYYEGPLMVFTAEYLRRRGYCCGSGCRNCPYNDAEKHRAGRISDELRRSSGEERKI